MLDTEKIIEEYYAKGSELYNILMIHSRQVCNYALELLYKHLEYDMDRQFVAEAAMLHDIGIFLCNAPSIHCYGSHDYIEHGYLGADLLRTKGLARHALVCERHTGVGITLEMIVKNDYPLPHRDMLPVTMEEKLICYADKFFSKTRINTQYTVEKAREKVARFGESEGVKFDELHALFSK